MLDLAQGILEEFSERAAKPDTYYWAECTLTLGSVQLKVDALAYQRQYNKWRQKDPKWRAKQNAHRRKMRALNPNYGR